MPSPRTNKQVQKLTGRIAALNRFISKSSDRCRPLFNLLRKNARFEWTLECEKTFDDLKKYLGEAPILSKPEEGENLYLYLAVSEFALSSVLVRIDDGIEKPVYF